MTYTSIYAQAKHHSTLNRRYTKQTLKGEYEICIYGGKPKNAQYEY